MTNGTVVILKTASSNVGAGMWHTRNVSSSNCSWVSANQDMQSATAAVEVSVTMPFSQGPAPQARPFPQSRLPRDVRAAG